MTVMADLNVPIAHSNKHQNMPEQHDYRSCAVENCIECQTLVNIGFIMGCDECGKPGEVNADGWVMQENGEVFCLHCDWLGKQNEKNQST